MTVLIADIETDGLLEHVTKVHSIVAKDIDTGEVISATDSAPGYTSIAEALRRLSQADLIVFHNGIKYDIPVLQKLFPDWGFKEDFDTIVAARLIWSNIKVSDLGRAKQKTLPGTLIGSHSLEAWGCRLKRWKGDYAKIREAELKAKHERMGLPAPDADELREFVWGTWTPEMQEYCEQDVEVTADLYRRIVGKGYSKDALELEHQTARVCAQIERNGYPFDEQKAVTLLGQLSGKRAMLEQELRDVFGTWVVNQGEVTPKASNSLHGYWGMKVLLDPEGKEVTHGAEEALTPSGTLKAKWKQFGYSMQFVGYPYTRVKFVAFNPASRAHIANRLTTLYGWEPQEFTPGGDPKIDETVLEGLDYPTAPLLNTYFLVQKRLGQLAEGNQAWLKVMRDGRIHGSINPNGAVTGRATHSFPNVAQVPSVKKDKEDNILLGLDGGYGHECRELFGVPEGWTQVGTDMSGLELRCLSHFMARWDGGEYGRILLTGDIHTANQQAAGLDTRNQAKTFAYAYLYGAGDAKLGSITGGGTKEGKRLRANFQAKIPALGKLTDAVKKKAKSGHLKGLDGRLLYVRSEHSALNTLLQSAGALICKKWLVLMDEHLLARGYKHGWDGDYAFLAWVHDEVQIAARTPALAAEITDLSKQCAREAEAFFGFRIQLDTDSKIGSSWATCH